MFIAAEAGNISRSRAKNIIEEGGVIVDGKPVARASYLVKGGERIEVEAGGTRGA